MWPGTELGEGPIYTCKYDWVGGLGMKLGFRVPGSDLGVEDGGEGFSSHLALCLQQGQ